MLRHMNTLIDAQRVTTALGSGPAIESSPDRTASLSIRRLNLMRAGYLLIGVGLALTRWPVMLQGAASLPLMDGVVAAMLTAMSLLAFLGLRYPVRLLPLLLFESLWKGLWLVAIALPHLAAGNTDPAFGRTLFSVALVVVVVAVTPWDYVWQTYVRAPGDPWRRVAIE
jgi:hypothetical protein